VVANELAEYQGCYNYNLQKYSTNLDTIVKNMDNLDEIIVKKDDYLKKKENIIGIKKTKKIINPLIITTNLEEVIKGELINPTIVNCKEMKDRNKLELWENKKRKRRNKNYSIKLKTLKLHYYPNYNNRFKFNKNYKKEERREKYILKKQQKDELLYQKYLS